MTAPVSVPPVSGTEHESVLPEFIRLPKVGERCGWTGLSRGSMNNLVLGENAPVKSIVLRQEKAKRGIRLIHLKSLLAYLHRQMAEQLEGETA